ncbi:MAG: XisI protein [Phaeodactylibacter xiamenensis]|uniref:XisI protein n=1 Tax=Phaeodactylibacter xiamenensis TaxID=1524460 RepID=A0A098SAA3_9BACT|nr:XisI protein [Phaeodactylibacter xiamenensis]KGE88573.1 hypothetical protein IX84_07790 [Phaeodactylibacter xiamenensis]MCR9050805.1 XisI protein [bacterium]
MDKIARYSHYITTLLNRYAQEPVANQEGVGYQVVYDLKSHHYLLLRLGWTEDAYIHYCTIHLDIIDEKIWLQQNNSDLLIADELVGMGVDRNDIIMGTDPAYIRNPSDFAAA